VNVVDWLLDSDPAIQWQVMRDLTHEPAEAVAIALLKSKRELAGPQPACPFPAKRVHAGDRPIRVDAAHAGAAGYESPVASDDAPRATSTCRTAR